MADDVELIKLKAREAKAEGHDFPVRGAVAAFLFKVMPVDGHTHPKELARLVRILCDDFSIEMEEAESLILHAKKQGNSLVSLTALADILKKNVDKKELLILISHMWEMVFADGLMHETEVLYVERVAILLDVPQEDVARAMNP